MKLYVGHLYYFLTYTKEELLGKMKILLAGKASEEIIFNHKSTGAKDDLKKVTEIANQMVCEYGMSNLGFMTLDGNNKTFLSEKIQDEANRNWKFIVRNKLRGFTVNV